MVFREAFDIQACQSYEDGIEIVTHWRPEIVVTHHRMAGSLADFMNTLRREFDIPILLVQSYHNEEVEDHAQRLRRCRVVCMPTDLEDLRQAVIQLCGIDGC